LPANAILDCNTSRPGRTAWLLRGGEDAAHRALLDAATRHFKRRVARDEIIVYRLGHA
jgi:predicted RNA-binding protein YlxR (DUF448 family)